MVSAKALFALYAISSIANSYPIHRHMEDSSLGSHHLMTRTPNPRFKNPFDVDHYLEDLDYKIPNNKNIQQWVKAARKKGALGAKKGALAAAGKFSHNGDDDEKDRDNDESDDDDDDEDDHDHDHDHEHNTKSASKPNNEHDGDDDDDDDDDDKVAQPATTHGSAPTVTVTAFPTPTTPSNTVNGAGDASPAQTVYVPVNVFPTRFPDFPDEDEHPSPSSTPLPIFPPPEDIAAANTPPAAVPPSSQDTTNTNGSEASESPVAQDTTATTTPDTAASPVVDEEPPSNDDLDSIPTVTDTSPQLPSRETQFTKIKEFLDYFTPKDQSEPSWRK